MLSIRNSGPNISLSISYGEGPIYKISLDQFVTIESYGGTMQYAHFIEGLGRYLVDILFEYYYYISC